MKKPYFKRIAAILWSSRTQSVHLVCGLVSVISCVAVTSAQSSSIDLKLATEYFSQLKQTSDRDAGRTWGEALYGPILFVDPGTQTVVANQADREQKLTSQDGLFVGSLPREISPANTAIDWSGVHWTMVTWPVSDFRQPRERLLLHECFHRIQNKLGLPVSDAVNVHLDSLNGRIWLQLEWRALERALRENGGARVAAVSDALLFRSYRRSLFPDAAKNENRLELNEGLAEYTGIKLSSTDLNEFIFRADLALRQARNNPTFARSFAYISGPAYGVLLDLSGKSWRTGLNGASDLGLLLQQRYDIKIKVSAVSARAALSRYEGQEIVSVETRQEERRQRQIADAKQKFIDGPALILPLTTNVHYSFDPNNVIGVDAKNGVYPTLRLVDDWGVLTVTGGAWLERDTTGQLIRARVTAPKDATVQPLKGEGWTLELKDGWNVVGSDRSGDVTLRKVR